MYIRVLLRTIWPCAVLILLELYRPLWTVLDASKAKLAGALHLYPLTGKFIVSARTDVCAYTTVDTVICHPETPISLHQKSYFNPLAELI